MQLFSADAKLFYFDHKKLKNHPQKLLRNTQKIFQPCTAKRPKKKNSVFKMWLKESLSIALGLKWKKASVIFGHKFRILAIVILEDSSGGSPK